MLGINIGQVAKEMPNFAISMKTGIMSLTNNLPMLAESIAAVRKEQVALKAEGKKTTSMLSLISKSVFGLTGFMSLAMVLLQLFSDDILNWAKSLFKANEQLDLASEKQAFFNKVVEDGNSTIDEAIEKQLTVATAFEKYREGTLSAGEALRIYNTELGENLGQMTDINEAMETYNNGIDEYIENQFKAALAENQLEKAVQARLEMQEAESDLREKLSKWTDDQEYIDSLVEGVKNGTEQIDDIWLKSTAKRLKSSIDEFDATKNNFKDLFKEYIEETKILEDEEANNRRIG